jgi:hypothetical protein
MEISELLPDAFTTDWAAICLLATLGTDRMANFALVDWNSEEFTADWALKGSAKAFIRNQVSLGAHF